MNETRSIPAIREGTVIDHIPSGAVMDVLTILKLKKYPEMISIGMNLKSKELQRKGIVKISKKEITQDELDKIAIVAPNATVNVIKDFKVTKKSVVSLPKELAGVIKCSNPICITNHEKVRSMFTILDPEKLLVRCHYCERDMNQKDIELL